MTDNSQIVTQGQRNIAARGKKMAATLSSYSRQLTMADRSRRNLYHLAGISPLLRDRVFSVALKAAFVLCFLIPFASAVTYFGFIASPQYQSEVQFVIRSAAPLLTRDRFSSANAEPEEKIAQDTQIVLNYVGSPALVAALAEREDLWEVYGRESIDYLSRLKPDASREDLIDYWEGQYESEVSPKSGIVTLSVSAFSAEEAFRILNIVLEMSENRINQMNAGIWSSLLTSAQQDVESASSIMEQLRLQLRDTQNATGVFDVELEAEGLSEIQQIIETEIALLKSQRAALGASLSSSAPVLKNLDQQIMAREQQALDLIARGAGTLTQEQATLSEQSRLFDIAQFELEIAEDRFKNAVEELEKVKLVSSLQLVYIDQFTEPTLAEDSTLPDVPLAIFLSLLASLAFWGVVGGGLILLRNSVD